MVKLPILIFYVRISNASNFAIKMAHMHNVFTWHQKSTSLPPDIPEGVLSLLYAFPLLQKSRRVAMENIEPCQASDISSS